MYLRDYKYRLPRSLIAQKPLHSRTGSRLMVVDRSSGGWTHSAFINLSEFLDKGDVVVLNRSRVLPARLFVKRTTGAKVEVFFVRKLEPGIFTALIKPAGRIRADEVLFSAKGEFALEVIGKVSPREARLKLLAPISLEEILETYGHVPLPPYITRADEIEDRSRYQTVYAREPGSVAAPTAGLHFSVPFLNTLAKKGIKVVSIVLHVGPGTFLPLEEKKVEQNKLSSESFSIDGGTLKKIMTAKSRGKRIIAVGTTVTRVLETAYNLGLVTGLAAEEEFHGETGLFIYPGYEFQMIDALLTNFHLPESSLLLLVSAFLGRSKTLSCYREAVKEKYRFYSYGDAMLIR